MPSREEQAKDLIPSIRKAYNPGEFEKCIEICDQGIKIDPFMIVSYYYKALSLIGMDKYEEALKVCSEAIEYMEDFDKEQDFKDYHYVRYISYARGQAYFHLKNYPEAMKWFERVEKLQPEYGSMWMETWLARTDMGKIHIQLGNNEEALKYFEKANERNSDYVDADLNAAILYHKMGKLDEALKKFKYARKLYSPLYWHTKGLLLLAQKKEKFAAGAFDKAEEYLAKGEHDSGQTRNERAEIEKAVKKDRDQLVSIHPRPSELKLENPKPMTGYDREKQAKSLIAPAYAEYKKGEYEICIEICDQAIATDPFIINPYYLKAYSLLGLDRPEDALKVCDIAVGFIEDFETDKDPHNEKCIRNICFARGDALFRLKNYKEAMKWFQHIVGMLSDNGKSWEEDWVACNNLGRCYYVFEEYEEALKWFEKANKVNHYMNYEDAYFNMALTYQKMGQLEKAMEVLDKILKDSWNPLYWNAQGLMYLEMKKDKFAARAFEKAEECIAKGVHIKGQSKKEQSEMEKTVFENRNKLLSVLARFAKIEFKDEKLIKQKDEILKDATQALQDPNNNRNFEDLWKRFEELANQNDALKAEMTEIKQVGDFEKEKKKKEEMAEIEAQQKLYNYYKSFNSFFHKTYVGYIAVSSNLVSQADQTPTPISLLTSLGQQVPMFGDLFGFLQTGISKYYEIKTTNEATRMVQLAKNGTEMNNMIDNVARAITLEKDKKEEILSIQEKKQNAFMNFINLVNKKIYVQEFDTPEKQLALKDATMLVMACAAGQVNSNKLPGEIEKEMFSVVIQGKFEQNVLEGATSAAAGGDKKGKAGSPAKSSNKAKVSPDDGSPATGIPKEDSNRKSACCNIF